MGWKMALYSKEERHANHRAFFHIGTRPGSRTRNRREATRTVYAPFDLSRIIVKRPDRSAIKHTVVVKATGSRKNYGFDLATAKPM